MPIYEYECPNCQFRIEKLVLQSEKPKRPDCPKCKQAKMKKVISASNFQLKGTGWYATDYGNKKSKNKKDPSCAPGGR